MKTITRQNCVITGEPLTPIYTLKKFPIAASCTDDSIESDLFNDVVFGCSPKGHVQLMELIDPHLLYDHFHSGGVVGGIWKSHHEKIFNMVNQDFYKDVLEIGGGSGELLKKFCQLDKDFKWLNVEPSDLPQVMDPRVKYETAFFENSNYQNCFDTIIHSHCFEHSAHPIKFLNKVNMALTNGGIQYISIPNMKHWLENNFTNTLGFEHTFYVDIQVLEYLLSLTGFQIVDQIVEPHSLFVKTKKVKNIELNDTDFTYVKNTFDNYVNYLENDIKTIKNKISNKRVFLFGAHYFSQTLFSLGLDQNQVIHILDNDPVKEHKRLYGTTCFVKSPKILKDFENPIIILRVGSYRNEIVNQIMQINPTSIIV